MTTEMIEGLLVWYEANRRVLPWRGLREPYAIWISEIMLQQTRVEAVKGYYARFMAALPTVQDLAEVDDDRLLKLWEGLGYYSRARNLKRAAQMIAGEFGGQFPGDPAQLIKLPGIGLYTAGAIASLAFDTPVPAVDGNVLRVYMRLTGDRSDIAAEQTKRAVAARLLPLIPRACPGTFNQALMELGACVCLPNGAPKCALCPLREDCFACLHQQTAELPVKSAKKPRRIEHRQLYILRCGDTLALRRRPAKGLLAGMLELPEAFPLPPNLVLTEEDAGRGVHIFTHREWHMTARKITLLRPPEDDSLLWITRQELAEVYALPSAFAGFREKLF